MQDGTTADSKIEQYKASAPKYFQSSFQLPKEELSLDQQFLELFDQLENFFVARKKSLCTRVKTFPVLKIAIVSSDICLDMIAMMRADSSKILSQYNHAKVSNNTESMQACQKIMAKYLEGFTYNLNQIALSYFDIMSKVSKALPIQPHFDNARDIFTLCEIIKTLNERCNLELVKQFGISHIENRPASSTWHSDLVGYFLAHPNPVYTELMVSLIDARQYDYQQLIFNMNKCEIEMGMLQHEIDNISKKPAESTPISTATEVARTSPVNNGLLAFLFFPFYYFMAKKSAATTVRQQRTLERTLAGHQLEQTRLQWLYNQYQAQKSCLEAEMAPVSFTTASSAVPASAADTAQSFGVYKAV